MKTIKGFYDVEPVDRSFFKVIPKRKAPVRPYPLLTMHQAEFLMHREFDQFGFEEYDDCWSCEGSRRSLPFISTDERPQRVLQKFMKYAPALFDFILPRIRIKPQSYNKGSALGYPVNGNPNIRRDIDEADVLTDAELVAERLGGEKARIWFSFYDQFRAGDFSAVEDAFTTINRRGQHELPSKIRTGLFINRSGEVYESEIDRRKDLVKINGLSGRKKIPLRDRNIFNPDVMNLFCQAVDTQIHHFIVNTPLCDANVYTKIKWDRSDFTTYDCNHYERYIGAIVEPYAELIGGIYAEQISRMVRQANLVPSDDWTQAFLIRPIFKPGQYLQLGSGLCVVTTVGKLANLVVTIAYFVEVHHLAVSDAIDATFRGEHNSMRRWMYGDDNRLAGSPSERAQYLKYIQEFFEITIDKQPKYLGTIWRADQYRFLLPSETFVLKGGLRERDHSFYTYPCLGQLERRETFRQFGEPEIGSHIIPFEDKTYDEMGFPFFEVVKRATVERIAARRLGQLLTREMVTDKEYLMSDEDKMRTGLYFGLSEKQTSENVLQIVSKTVREKLNLGAK